MQLTSIQKYPMFSCCTTPLTESRGLKPLPDSTTGIASAMLVVTSDHAAMTEDSTCAILLNAILDNNNTRGTHHEYERDKGQARNSSAKPKDFSICLEKTLT